MRDPSASITGGAAASALGAVLFMQSGTMALDVYSAVNSSPWTAENVGADDAKVASLREYVRHAIVLSTIFGVGAAAIAGSWWPVLGLVLANVYMYWLYDRAVKRGQSTGSTTWANAGPAMQYKEG